VKDVLLESSLFLGFALYCVGPPIFAHLYTKILGFWDVFRQSMTENCGL